MRGSAIALFTLIVLDPHPVYLGPARSKVACGLRLDTQNHKRVPAKETSVNSAIALPRTVPPIAVEWDPIGEWEPIVGPYRGPPRGPDGPLGGPVPPGAPFGKPTIAIKSHDEYIISVIS